MEARATERSGGNVSYAQHVIFGDPSEHFFVGGTVRTSPARFATFRARARACVRVCGYGDPSERDKEKRTRATRLSETYIPLACVGNPGENVCVFVKSIVHASHVYPVYMCTHTARTADASVPFLAIGGTCGFLSNGYL